MGKLRKKYQTFLFRNRNKGIEKSPPIFRWGFFYAHCKCGFFLLK